LAWGKLENNIGGDWDSTDVAFFPPHAPSLAGKFSFVKAFF
jgi:hypothetical protein